MIAASRSLVIATSLASCAILPGSAACLATDQPHRKPRIAITNSIGMRLVEIPAGAFLMGSAADDKHANADEQPQHRVQITQPFYLGVFEVTQQQYQMIMGENPSEFSARGRSRKRVTGLDTSRFPVEHVRWTEALEFCGKLSRLPAERSAGRVYRLPSEAEWEFACRAGTTTSYHFGNALSSTQANFNGKLPSPGAQPGPFLGRPTTVGSYQANAWGLYDMHGNVWEWCSDWFRADYYQRAPAEDPPGAPSAPDRSVRGGSWADDGLNCRTAYRFNVLPVYRFQTRGFRVAMTIGDPLPVAQSPPPSDTPQKPLTPAAAERQAFFDSDVRPFLKTYCYECHTGDKPEAGLSLDRFQHARELASTGRKTWNRIRDQLLSGAMPPQDARQPTQADSERMAAWIQQAVAAVDCSQAADPGHETIRRLNRAEYRNTIRDLLGVDYPAANTFPTDDVGASGDALSIAPILMERYLTAAEVISEQALATNLSPAGIAPASRRILFTQPGPDQTRRAAARSVLKRLATQAYRRPVTDVELERLLRLVDSAQQRGDSFRASMRLALQAILVSPHFLFRVEQGPVSGDPQAIRQLNGYELATRMSYFLWSSMPDGELFQHAQQETLHDNLDRQVRRMLVDPKSRALSEHFGGQWLQLTKLQNIRPDKQVFPEFDDALRAAMQTETRMFLAALIRENRSMLDVLTADFTFVNQRLARHYGLPRLGKDGFQRVSLANTRRGGVLTQASILTLTSNPTRTSPVKRGKWIMETILGTPPPAPPPGSSELKPSDRSAASGSLRDRMANHTAVPRCAVCHKQMDALGFALENFDAVGRWRDHDGRFPIDASAALPGGQTFTGPIELNVILSNRRKQEFLDCLTESMLAYALGRDLEYYDHCAVDKIKQRLEMDNDRFVTLITQIIHSQPFQKTRGHRKNDRW